jgi:hypothetical protein
LLQAYQIIVTNLMIVTIFLMLVNINKKYA